MITTVVFDLDDTLYDEIDYCRSGFSAAAEFLTNRLKISPAEQIFEILWKEFTSGNRTKTFNSALDTLDISYDDGLIDEIVDVYRSHIPKITLPQDSRQILDRLRPKYNLGLLTDGFLPAQKLKVQALGIEEYFKCIVYTEELGRNCWKPSPAGFNKIMDISKTGPENTVYIADNEKKDFIAPNQLGILTIQIIRPSRLHTETTGDSNAQAKYVVHQLHQLPDILNKSADIREE
jgi:putative hydrolase of the HAD superfamily